MNGTLVKYFGWSYSRTIQVIKQQRQAPNALEIKFWSRSYTNSQFVGKQRKQMTQRNKKRYLKRINTLDPDHDIDMEGTLSHIFNHQRLYSPRRAISIGSMLDYETDPPFILLFYSS